MIITFTKFRSVWNFCFSETWKILLGSWDTSALSIAWTSMDSCSTFFTDLMRVFEVWASYVHYIYYNWLGGLDNCIACKRFLKWSLKFIIFKKSRTRLFRTFKLVINLCCGIHICLMGVFKLDNPFYTTRDRWTNINVP